MACARRLQRIVVECHARQTVRLRDEQERADHADETAAAAMPLGPHRRAEDMAGAPPSSWPRAAGDYVVGSTLVVDGGCAWAR